MSLSNSLKELNDGRRNVYGRSKDARGAMLVNIKGHEYWIPNSQVSSIDAIYVTMTSWIAEAKGII